MFQTNILHEVEKQRFLGIGQLLSTRLSMHALYNSGLYHNNEHLVILPFCAGYLNFFVLPAFKNFVFAKCVQPSIRRYALYSRGIERDGTKCRGTQMPASIIDEKCKKLKLLLPFIDKYGLIVNGIFITAHCFTIGYLAFKQK